MSKTQFGGGNISPTVAAHLIEQAQPKPSKPSDKATPPLMGGGNISPSVARHLNKR